MKILEIASHLFSFVQFKVCNQNFAGALRFMSTYFHLCAKLILIACIENAHRGEKESLWKGNNNYSLFQINNIYLWTCVVKLIASQFHKLNLLKKAVNFGFYSLPFQWYGGWLQFLRMIHLSRKWVKYSFFFCSVEWYCVLTKTRMSASKEYANLEVRNVWTFYWHVWNHEIAKKNNNIFLWPSKTNLR